MKYRIPEAEIRVAVASSTNLTEVIQKLGLSVGGGQHHRRFERRLMEMGINTSHFTTRARETHSSVRRSLVGDILVQNSTYTSTVALKNRLLKEGLLEPRCSNPKCGIGTEWAGAPLVLQLDHINGVGNDHRLENLRLLCPNCHSQTHTYAGKNHRPHLKQHVPKRDVCPCGQSQKMKSSPQCRACFARGTEKITWPEDNQLRTMVWERPVEKVAAQLGITGVAVTKRCRRLGITTPPRGYWQKLRKTET